MLTSNPYTDPAERDAWARGYACYRPQTRDGGDAFTALWATLDKVARTAAYDGWVCAVIDADRAGIAAATITVTDEQAADDVVQRALKSALLADPDGLDTPAELERKPKPQEG